MNIKRDIALTNKIVLLDGITGTGKTMFMALMNSSSKTMASQFVYTIEYINILCKLQKISINDASVLLKLIADEKYYNNLISREVNFRPNDLSSVFKSTKGIKYLKQLFSRDGGAVENRLMNEKPILSLVTHQLFCALDPMFYAFDKRLFVIEMERHPLFLIKHWFTWIDLYGINARDMTICFEHNGHSLPWFSEGWGDLFLASNSIDRVIYSLNWLTSESDKVLERFPKNQVAFIPFEDFVLNPDKYIEQLKKILEEEDISQLVKAMRKQNVPRKNIFDGPNKKIYRRYAFQKSMASQTHEQSYNDLLAYARANASDEAFAVLEKLNAGYEKKYGLWF
jgi:hypothetical protein